MGEESPTLTDTKEVIKMTLLELTGHEAGIIVYKDGSAIVVNWNQCEDDYIPALAPVGDTVINFPQDHGYIERAQESKFDDIRPILQNITVLLDEFNDIARLMSNEPDKYGIIPDHDGTKYEFEDGLIIYTFADWN
jgi:hypothetical protein